MNPTKEQLFETIKRHAKWMIFPLTDEWVEKLADEILALYPDISDADIQEWACVGYDENVGMDEITQGRIEGAIAMRDGGINKSEK